MAYCFAMQRHSPTSVFLRALTACALALLFTGCYGISVVRVSVVDATDGHPLSGYPVRCGAPIFRLRFSSADGTDHSASTGRDNAVWFFDLNNTDCMYAFVEPRLHDGHYCGRWGHRQGLPLPLLHLPVHFIRLKPVPVRNPVPLKVVSIGHRMPEGGGNAIPDADAETPIAIDLLEGDWLPPWGNGKVADVLAYRTPLPEGTWGNPRFAMKLVFPGTGNGLCRVEPDVSGGPLVWEAPESGYVSEHEFWNGHGTDRNYDEDNPPPCHCFRIRSEFDEAGRLVSCHYGKIYGDFRIGRFSPVGWSPKFRGYVNPKPADPNLEPLPPFPASMPL